MQCIIMTLTGGGGAIEFESSCIVIYFSYIYLGINGERSIHEINQGLKLWARVSIAQFVSCCFLTRTIV